MLIYILIFLMTFCLWWYYITRPTHRFPPGPRFPLPIIGTAYVLRDGNLVKSIADLRKTYGDIFSLHLNGSDRCIFIADYDIAQKYLTMEGSQHKKVMPVGARLRGGYSLGESVPGVLLSSGQTWIEQRRFVLHKLRDFGFGKDSMEDVIDDELDTLMKDIERLCDGGKAAMDTSKLFTVPVVNALWRICTGKAFAKSDKRLEKMIESIDIFLEDIAYFLTNAAAAYRVVEVITENLGLTRIKKSFGAMFQMCREQIEEQKAIHDPNDHPRNLIEAYLTEVGRAKPGSSFYGKNGELNMQGSLFDLFFAGVETTSTTLNWAMLFMAKNPDVQTKVQKELDEVVGRNRNPQLEDRQRTPYLEAVIQEVQRKSSIAALSAFHHSPPNQVTHVGPYEIPPNTMVFTCLFEIMHDPKNFENPSEFKPERFIGPNGDFVPCHKVVPFSMGKRRCLGEALAKQQLYCYLSRILHHFTIQNASPDGELSDKPVEGITLTPKPFKVRFNPRY